MKKTIIIIPVHNALDYLRNTIDAALQTTATDIVVVDDASDELTKTYLYELESKGLIKLAVNSKQQLFTRTVNRGIRYINRILDYTPDYVCILNSDCVLASGWLTAMESILTDNSDIGLVGYEDSPQTADELFTEVVKPGYITGHCVLHRWSNFEQVGVYCETDLSGVNFPELAPFKGCAHIGSDRLMSYQLNDAGLRTVYLNKPLLQHSAGKSWNHDLQWLSAFNLDLLSEPKDTL